MRLYHFTDFYNLENVGPGNILAVGLRAGADWMKEYSGCFLKPPPRNAIWLTSEAVFFERTKECRIEVEIPRSDSRLFKWNTYLERYGKPGLMEAAKRADAEQGSNTLSSWWLYFGDIPARRIVAIEYADPARRAAARNS